MVKNRLAMPLVAHASDFFGLIRKNSTQILIDDLLSIMRFVGPIVQEEHHC